MESKKGRLTNDERQYIASLADDFTADQIATKLGRTVETVQYYIKRFHVPKNIKDKPVPEQERAEKAVIRQELRNSEEWKRLKDEFTKEEILLFEEKFIALMGQFKGNVLPSEQTQIMMAVKFEILMSRNLKDRRRAVDDIERLERMQEDYLKQFGGIGNMSNADKQLALSFEQQIQGAKAAEQSKTTEYVKLQERHQRLMHDLKATRDQRVKDFESGKVSFLGLIKSLQQKEMQEYEGRQMELMRMATDKEYNRLGQLHQYEDGQWDRPILSPETVDLEDVNVES